MKRDYGSRKFTITAAGMGLGCLMTGLGVIAKVPDGYWTALPALFILLAAGISAYNWANLRQSQNGSAPK